MTMDELIKKLNGRVEPGINWFWVYFETLEEAQTFKQYCEENLDYLEWRGISTPWRADQEWKYACSVHY